jgi:hypothetical protein
VLRTGHMGQWLKEVEGFDAELRTCSSQGEVCCHHGCFRGEHSNPCTADAALLTATLLVVCCPAATAVCPAGPAAAVLAALAAQLPSRLDDANS